MAQISKCNALTMAFSLETSEKMLILGYVETNHEMAEHAKTMHWSSIGLRVTIVVASLLVLFGNYGKESDPADECLFDIVCVTTTGAAAYALKNLYDTACYLQSALDRYPRLRAELFSSIT